MLHLVEQLLFREWHSDKRAMQAKVLHKWHQAAAEPTHHARCLAARKGPPSNRQSGRGEAEACTVLYPAAAIIHD